MAVFEELEAAGHDCELRQDGALTVARNAAEVKMARADYARLKSNGHDVVYLEGAEAVVTVEPALAGGDYLAALHSRRSGHVNAAAATKALADSASALGATISVASAVVAIERLPAGSKHRYRALTSDGRAHDCATLVIAAGAWARPLGRTLGLDIPVFPVKGQIWSSPEAPEGTLRKVIFAYEK
jgi:glycine oxidase